MLYNKRQYRKDNDKKLLHKVKKQWVVVSLALFSVLGTGGIATYNVNAQANQVDSNQSSEEASNASSYHDQDENSQNSNEQSNHDVNRTQGTSDNSSNEESSSSSQSTTNSSLSNNQNSLDKNQSNDSSDNKNGRSMQSSSSQNNTDTSKIDSNKGINSNNQTSDLNNQKNSGTQSQSSSQNSTFQGRTSQNTTDQSNLNQSNNNSSQSNDSQNDEDQKDNNNSQSSQNASSSSNNETNDSNNSQNNNQPNSRNDQNNNQSRQLNHSNNPNNNQSETDKYALFDRSGNDQNSDDEQKISGLAKEGAVNAWHDLHPDNSQGTNLNDPDDVDTDYYKNGYSGVNDANDAYQKGTQNTGTSSNYNNSDSNKQNDKSSVSNNTPNIPQPTDITPKSSQQQSAINQDDNEYQTYQYGVNYFLQHQGSDDANSGKWNGNNNTVYTPNRSGSNPYDQSYAGAQDAMNKQFDSSNNYNSSNFATTNNADPNYSYGYNNTVNNINNGAIYVNNSNQFYNGTMYSNRSNTQIHFTRDMDMSGQFLPTASEGYVSPNIYSLTMDGGNHIVDFGGYSYGLYHSGDDSTVKNFHKLYDTDYYGPTHIGSGTGYSGTVNYSNLNYTGSQLIYSTNAKVNISGNVNAASVYHYNTPWKSGVTTEDYDQQNMQVNNLELMPNSSYNGSTEDGNVIELGGNLTMEHDSTMNLAPGGTSPENIVSGSNGSEGLSLSNNNANLMINNNAHLNVNPQQSNGSPVNAINMNGGSMDINGGSVTSNLNGPAVSHTPIYLGGDVTTRNGGTFNVNGINQSDYDGNLLRVSGALKITSGAALNINASGMNSNNGANPYLVNTSGSGINITNRGNMSLITDGSGNPTLYVGQNGTFNINDPGKQVVMDIKNNGSGALFSNPKVLNGYSVRMLNGYPSATNKPTTSYWRVAIPNNTGDIYYYDPSKKLAGNNSDNLAGLQDSHISVANSKYLSFEATPTAYFNGPASIQRNSNSPSGYSVNGNLILDNINDLSDQDRKQPITLSVNLDNNSQPDSSNLINLPQGAQDGTVVPYNYNLNKKPNNQVDLGSHYFVTDLHSIINNGVNGNNATTDTIIKNPTRSDDSSGSDNLPFKNMTDNADSQNALKNANVNGENDALAGNAANDSNSSYSNDSKQEYHNSYDATSAGLKSNPGTYIPNRYANNQQNYKDGQAASAGSKDALNNNNDDSKYYNDDNSKNHYNGANNATKDGLNNQSSSSDNVYHPSYQAGYQQYLANTDASQRGSKSAISGNKDSTDPNNNDNTMSKDSYTKGHDAAQNGMSSQAGTSVPSGLDRNQTIAYVNGQAAAAGTSDVVNQTDNSSHYQNDPEKTSYLNARAAAQNGYNGGTQTDNDKANAPSYQAGAQQKITNDNATQNGMKSALSGNSSNQDTNQTDNEPAKKMYTDAHDAAQSGLNSQPGTPAPSDYNNDQKSAYKQGQAASAGAYDITNRTNHSNNYSNEPESTAYNNATRAAQDGLNGNSESDVDKNNDPAYQAGSKQRELNTNAKQNGINQVLNGNNQASDSNPNDNGPAKDLYSKNYQAAQAGLRSQPGTPAPSDYNDDQKSAYKQGQAASIGANDAINETDNSSKYSGTAKDAYNNAYDAAQDGLNNKPETDNDNANQIAYQSGNKQRQSGDQAGQNATNSVINGSDQSTDPNNSDNKRAKTQYQNNYQAAQAGMNSQPGISAPNNYNDNQKSAYNQAQAAKAAANDIANGTDDSGKYQNEPEKDVYDNAKVAAQNGLNGNNESDMDKVNDPAYQIGVKQRQNNNIASQNGTNSALSGNTNNEDSNSDDNKLARDSYQKAYDSAQAGMNNQSGAAVPSDYDNNQKSAYNQGQAAKAAADDVVSGTDYSSYYSNEPANTAYNNAKIAAQNGLNGNTESNNDKNNDPAYQAGLRQYQSNGTAGKSGTNSALSGNDNDTDPNQNDNSRTKKSYQQNYDAAKTGMSSSVGTPAPSDYNNDQKSAYNQGQAAKAAADDVSNDTDNFSKYQNEPEKDVYINAKVAAQNGLNGNNESDTDKINNPAYQAGLKQHQANDNAKQNGINTALSGNTNNEDLNANDNKLAKDAYQKAHDATQVGMNSQSGAAAPSGYDANQKSAYNQGQAAKAAVDDISNGTDNSGKYPNNPESSAYVNAKSAAQNGLNGNSETDTDKTNDPAYQMGVKQSQNNNIASQNGTNSALSGNTNNEDLNANDNNLAKDAYQKAYDATQAGMNNRPGAPVPNDYDNNQKSAYNQGQAAKAAADDVVSGTDHSSDYSNEPANTAYNNAKIAAQSGLNGNSESNTDKNNDPAYQAGLKQYQSNGTARKNGTNSALSGNANDTDPNQNDNSQTKKSYQQNYDAAKAGMNSLVGTPAPTDYNSDQKSSYNQGQAAKDAANDIANGTDNSSKYQNEPEKDVYNNAKVSAQNGLNGNNESDMDKVNDPAYQIGVKQHHANDNASQNGINTALSGNTNNEDLNTNDNKLAKDAYQKAHDATQVGMNSQSGAAASSGYDANQKSAYNQGQAAKVATDDVSNGTDNSSKYQNEPEKDVYDNAKVSAQNGLNGNNESDMDKANNPAYQIGLKQRQNNNTASQNGTNSALSGNTNNEDLNTNDNKLAKDAYQRAHDATQAGINNHSGTSAPNDYDNDQKSAYDQGQAAKAAMNDIVNGTNSANDYPDNPERDAYNNAKIAAQSGLNGNSESNTDKNNDPAYQAGLKQYQSNGTAGKSGTNSALSGNANDTDPNQNDNSQTKKSYQQNYDAAKVGMNSSTGTSAPSDYNDDQKSAYNQGQAAKVAADDVANGTDNSGKYPNDPEKSSYINAQIAAQNGLNGNSETNSDKANDSAYQIGIKQYQNNVKASQSGLAAALSGNENNEDPNKSDNNLAKYAYKLTHDAANAGINSRPGDTAPGIYNDDQKSAYSQGQAARVAADDVANGTDNSGKYPNDPEKTAYNDAKLVAQNGLDGVPESNTDRINDPAYQIGIKQHQNNVKASQSGLAAALSGNTNNEDVNSNDNNLAKNAYKAAHDAASSGMNSNPGDSAPSNYDDAQKLAYNQGQAAKAASNDVTNGTDNSNKYSGNPGKMAYADAKIAAQNGLNGVSESNTDKTNDPAYQIGSAQRQINTRASQNGLNAALSGKISNEDTNNDDNNPAKDAYKASHDAAYAGMNSQVNSSAPVDYNDAQKSAYNQGQAAKAAVDDISNGTDNSGKYPNNPEKTAYINAKVAAQNGLNGNSESAGDFSNNLAYQIGSKQRQTNMKAIQNGTNTAINGQIDDIDSNENDNIPAKQLYQQSFDATRNGLNSQPGVSAPSNYSDVQKSAYSQGQAANVGANDAINNNDNSKYYQNDPEKTAYINAKVAAQNGIKHPSANPNGQNLSGNDAVNIYAYEKGQRFANMSNEHASKQATNDAIAGRGNGIDPNYRDSDDAKNSYRISYDATQAGFNNINSSDQNSDSYKQGQAARVGAYDTVNGNDNSNRYLDNPEKSAYTAAQDAARDGLAGNSESASDQNNSLAYQVGLKQHQINNIAGQNGINVALSGNANNEDSNTNDNDLAKKSYQLAHDATQVGMHSQLGDLASNDYNDAQKAAYSQGQAAKTATDDVTNGTDHSGNYSNNLEKLAYDNAKTAAQNGLNGNSESNIDKINDPAYQAGIKQYQNNNIAGQNGINNALSGDTSNVDSNGDDNSLAKAAYQKNHDAAYDGMNSSVGNSIPTNYNDAQKAAYVQGQAAKAAVDDVINGTDHSGNYSNDLGKSAYNNAKLAAQNGLNGKVESNIDKDNNPAYQAGLKQYNANNAANQSGISNALSGNTSNIDGNDLDNKLAKAAYKETHDATQTGMNSSIGSSTPSDYSDVQKAAYVQGQAAKAAIDDVTNGTDHSNQYLSNPEKLVYANAKIASQNGLNGNVESGLDKNNNLAYQAGMRQHRINITASQNGINTALSGNPDNEDKSINDNDLAKAAYRSSHDAAYDGMNSSIGSSSPSDYNDVQKAAYNQGQAVRAATFDVTNGTDNSNYYPNDPEKSAYAKAQLAAQNGLNGKLETNIDRANDSAYQAGIKQHQNNVIAHQNGITAALSGTSNNQDLNQSDNKLAKSAYTESFNAVNFGMASSLGESTPNYYNNDQILAYNQGQAAKVAANDVANETDNSSHYSNEPEKSAYNNAKIAAQNGLRDKNESDSDQKNDPAYQAGKNQLHTNKLAIQSGIKLALSGNSDNKDPNNNDNNPAKSEYQKAHDATQVGMNSQPGSAAPNNYNDDQRLAYNQGQAAKAAIDDVANETDNSDFYQNDPERLAYDNSKLAAQSGLNNKAESELDKANDPGYQAGLSQRKYNDKAAQDGINAVLHGNVNDIDNNKYDNSAKDAYRRNYNAARNGINSQTNTSVPNGYNDDQKAAYNQGQAAKRGFDDALNGNYNNPYQSDPEKSIYNNAYNTANDGLNNKASNDNESNAYKAGQAAKQGLSDALNGNNHNPYVNDPEKSAYDNANSATNDGLNSKPSTDNNSNVYQAGQAAKHGLDDALNGNEHNPYASDPEKSAYNNSYKDTQNAINGIPGVNKDSDAYKIGQAILQGKNDAIDYKNNNPYANDPEKSAYDNGHKAYMDGYNDGENYNSSHESNDINYDSIYKAGHYDGQKAELESQPYQSGENKPIIFNNHQNQPKNNNVNNGHNVKVNHPNYIRILHTTNMQENGHKVMEIHSNKYHTFKVLNAYDENGHMEYKIRNHGHTGYITGDSHYVRNAYYQSKEVPMHQGFNVKIVAPSVVEYLNKKYNDNEAKHVFHQGDIIKVTSIENYGRMTRFVLENGDYITSNKNYVELTHKKVTPSYPNYVRILNNNRVRLDNGEKVKVHSNHYLTFKVLGTIHGHFNRIKSYKVSYDGHIGYLKNNRHVVHAYYRSDEVPNEENFNVQVIAPHIVGYSNKHYDQNHAKKVFKRDEIINVSRVVQYGRMTRFITNNGHYITSNKNFVRLVK